MKNKSVKRDCIIIIALTVLIFLNTSGNDFVYDDLEAIVNNPSIRDTGNIPLFFTNPGRTAVTSELLQNVYRPLLMTTFALNYAAGGLDVAGYHLVSISLHAANAVLLYLLILAMAGTGLNAGGGNAQLASLLISLFFAVHPVNTEAVNYIWQRSELMASFFYLVTLLCMVNYMRGGKALLYAAAVVSFVMALLTKEMAVTVPVVLLLFDWYFISSFKKDVFMRNLKRYYLPFIVLAVVYACFRLFSYRILRESGTGGGSAGWGAFKYFITQARVIIQYLRLMVFPRGLSVHHDVPLSSSLSDPTFLASGAVILLMIAGAVMMRKKLRTYSFFILWFFIMLIPTSSVIPLYPVIMNEHRIYLAGAGLVAVFVLASTKKSTLLLMAVLLVLCASLTVKRNSEWKDSFTLWSAVAREYPDNYMAYFNLGVAHVASEQYDKGIEYYRKAVSIKPDYAEAYYNLGVAYGGLGKYDDALDSYKQAIGIKPDYGAAYCNLGGTYVWLGRYSEAVESYKEALRINPSDANTLYNLKLLGK